MTDVIAASPGRSPDIVPAEQSLEKVFGDPFGAGHFSWASIVADDRASRRDAAIARSIAEWGVGRALIPASLGGEWSSTPELVRRLRPLFRRDPSLGCAVVASSLTPAVAVWIAGDAATAAGWRRCSPPAVASPAASRMCTRPAQRAMRSCERRRSTAGGL